VGGVCFHFTSLSPPPPQHEILQGTSPSFPSDHHGLNPFPFDPLPYHTLLPPPVRGRISCSLWVKTLVLHKGGDPVIIFLNYEEKTRYGHGEASVRRTKQFNRRELAPGTNAFPSPLAVKKVAGQRGEHTPQYPFEGKLHPKEKRNAESSYDPGKREKKMKDIKRRGGIPMRGEGR